MITLFEYTVLFLGLQFTINQHKYQMITLPITECLFLQLQFTIKLAVRLLSSGKHDIPETQMYSNTQLLREIPIARFETNLVRQASSSNTTHFSHSHIPYLPI